MPSRDPKKKGLQHLIILAFISFSLSFYSDRRASISQIIFDFETQTQHRQNQKEKICDYQIPDHNIGIRFVFFVLH